MPILRGGARTEMEFTDGTYGHSHYLQDREPVWAEMCSKTDTMDRADNN